MKKTLASVVICMLLIGCAATEFRHARANANLVKNGMTVQQAIELIGSSPTNKTSTALEWRRGNAQTYDATTDGAVIFHVADGVIIDVPEGGIFGPEARRLYLAAREAQREQQRTLYREQQEKQAKAAAAAAEERAAEIEAEIQAAAHAKVSCNLKSNCSKVFALAQIYVATETDQKIQVVTDSVIQTYNPTDVGHVGASIIKMPGRNDDAEVSLSLSCKSGNTLAGESLCRIRNTRVYKGFRTFIERRLVE